MKHLTNLVIALAIGCCLFVYATTSPPRATGAAATGATAAAESALLPRHGPIARSSFRFAGAEFIDVANEIARRGGANIILSPDIFSPDVRATVTLVTRNLPWSDVLAAAAGSIGAAVEVMDSGIVRVVAASAPNSSTMPRRSGMPKHATRSRPIGSREVAASKPTKTRRATRAESRFTRPGRALGSTNASGMPQVQAARTPGSAA